MNHVCIVCMNENQSLWMMVIFITDILVEYFYKNMIDHNLTQEIYINDE